LMVRYTLLSNPAIRLIYKFNSKNSHLSKQDKKSMTELEINLWRINDLRTQGSMMYQIHVFKMLPIKVGIGIDLIVAEHDRWINSESAVSNLQQIYTNVDVHSSSAKMHGITIIDNEFDVSRFVPESFRRVLEGL
jgi:hypothetical protein